MGVSRRNFIGASSAGAIGAAGAVVFGSDLVSSLASAHSGVGGSDDLKVDGPVLVYVKDASTGQLELLVGDRVIPFMDKRLVARVLREV
jgi:hypothetical protein